jgi:hypothetical protein
MARKSRPWRDCAEEEGERTQNEVGLPPGFRAPERNRSLIVPVGEKGFDLQENKMHSVS